MTAAPADPFATASETITEDAGLRLSMATAPFGVRIDHLGRYKMPLLPGESGPKSGGDWVPRGVQSATNLAGAIVESRQLGIWERERCQIGLALRPDLAERTAFLIRRAVHAGTDLHYLNESPAGKEIKAELELIHVEAKKSAGGELAAARGTIRHDVWEARGKTGELFGTPGINQEIETLESLLERKGLERVPGLQERTVRNVSLGAAGRFDDVLCTTRDIEWINGVGGLAVIPAGTLLMADLKTKRRAFYSHLEVRIQLAVYATAEWMLADSEYVAGPKYHVSQDWGVILRMPSDGSEPELKRVNLRKGYEQALLARAVCDARSEAKNVAAHGEAAWPDSEGPS